MAGCAASSGASSAGLPSGQEALERYPAGERVPLPALEGETLAGDHLDVADYDGDVLVFNVWGSWCPPCREEAPALRRVWEEAQSEGVQFIGINVRDNDAAARAYEREFDLTYPSIKTSDSAAALVALSTHLPQGAVPATLVVDRQGRIAARIIGATTYTTLRDLVDEVLAEPASGAATAVGR